MKVGSLFSGIGGFDLGLERAGMRTVWQVEQSEFRRMVLARHFPGARRYEDVRAVGADSLERVDLICGGFPCQDISLAGRGAGIDGARSGLWAEMFRIVCELEPRWVVVENVPALTSRGLDRVLRDLAQGGYDAEWDCLPASAFGAPHRRDRIWLVAYPSGERGRLQPVAVTGSGGAAGASNNGEARLMADANGSGGEARRGDGLGASTRAVVGQPACSGGEGVLAHSEGEPVGAGLRAGRPRGIGRGRPGASGVTRGVIPDADSERLQADQGRGRDPERLVASRDEPPIDVADTSGSRRDSGQPEIPEGESHPARSGDQDPDSSALQSWRVGGRAAQAGGAEWWSVEPPVGRVAHGVPNRLDQLAALGDALVPQIAEWIGHRIMSYETAKAAA